MDYPARAVLAVRKGFYGEDGEDPDEEGLYKVEWMAGHTTWEPYSEVKHLKELQDFLEDLKKVGK